MLNIPVIQERTDKDDNKNRFELAVVAAARAKQLENIGMPYQKKFSVLALQEIKKGFDINLLKESIIHGMQKHYKSAETDTFQDNQSIIDDLSVSSDEYLHHSQDLALSDEDIQEIEKLEQDNSL